MSESHPLLGQQGSSGARTNDHDEYEEFEDHEFKLSPRAKYSLYALGGVLGVAVLYFFTIYLPNAFIPQAVELQDIQKVDDSGVRLVPITRKVAHTGKLHRMQENQSDEEQEERQEEDSEDEFGEFDVFESAVFDGVESVYASLHESVTKYHRIIMIGDIHGHYSQFRKLLRKVNYDRKNDYLLVLGDFITKGPDSFKVLDYLIKNDVACILGNHEYYVMQYYAQFHGLKFPDFVVRDGKEHAPSPGVSIAASFNDDPEFLLAKKLQPSHIKYINKCPLIKKLGDVPVYGKKAGKGVFGGVTTKNARPGVAVHGGLRWDLSLEDQHPVEVLEMRSLIGPHFNESTDDPREPNAVSWSKVWNRYQKTVAADETAVVYYGHDARRGLNLKKFSKGLDSGCDRGASLSAIVLWDEAGPKGTVRHKEQVVQVKCN